jgi:hypothetical protein
MRSIRRRAFAVPLSGIAYVSVAISFGAPIFAFCVMPIS